MKKKRDWFIPIVMLSLIVIIGGFIVLVINYTIENMNEQELHSAMDGFNFMNWALIFFPLVGCLCLLLMYWHRNDGEKPMEEG